MLQFDKKYADKHNQKKQNSQEHPHSYKTIQLLNMQLISSHLKMFLDSRKFPKYFQANVYDKSKHLLMETLNMADISSRIHLRLLSVQRTLH